MLSTPTKEALIALEQVSKFPRWTDVDRMIEAELSKILELIMATRDGDALNELRGRACALKEFQQECRDAPVKLAKMGVRPSI